MPDHDGIKGRGLNENILSVFSDSRGGAALYARQRDRLLGISDDQLGSLEFYFSRSIADGKEAFAFTGHANDDLLASECVEVKNMCWLPKFKEHKVGGVNHI